MAQQYLNESRLFVLTLAIAAENHRASPLSIAPVLHELERPSHSLCVSQGLPTPQTSRGAGRARGSPTVSSTS